MALIGGCAIMLIGIYTANAAVRNASFYAVLAGFLIGVSGGLFGILAIRCPACGARWAWQSIKTQSVGRWLPWLVSRTQCPSCGKEF